MKFKNRYSGQGRKEEFFTKQENKEDLTDQSQISSASISSMAKKFGIDALIAKAQKMNIENEKILDQLYGNDYTKMFTSRDELLNTKKKLNNLFEHLPAKMRKEVFNDNVMEFVNAYTTNDENKLTQLHKLGIVDEHQLNSVKSYNANIRAQKQEAETKARFIAELERNQGAIYENFKKTGNISINNMQNNTVNNENVQGNLQ